MLLKFYFIAILFKLCSFETPLRFMRKWMNSNNRREVTDQTFAAEICLRCTFDKKNKIPHWSVLSAAISVFNAATSALGAAIAAHGMEFPAIWVLV